MGAGAVGGWLAARLAQAAERQGLEVWAIARGAHLEAIKTAGLLVKTPEGELRARPQATGDPSSLGEAGLILSCVKTYDLEDSCRRLSANLGPGTILVTLQNGVEAPERAAAVVGRSRVVGGIVYGGFRLAGPGVVEQATSGRLTVGELDGPPGERVERLRVLFEACAVPCRVSANIVADMWKKLIWNVGFNAASALLGRTAQEVLASAEGEALVREAMDELVGVAQAKGLPLTPEMAAKNIELTRGAAGAILPSMAQDIARRKPTEIEEMNGLVARLGEQFGVATPVNRTLARLIRLREGGRAP